MPTTLRLANPQPALQFEPSTADAAMVNTGSSASAPLTLVNGAFVSRGQLAVPAATAAGACAAVTLPSAPLSAAFWVRMDTTALLADGEPIRIFHLALGGSCAAAAPDVTPFAASPYPFFSFRLYKDATTDAGLSLHLSDPSPAWVATSGPAPMTAGKWVHIAAVFTAAGTTVFANGAQAATSAGYFSQPGAGVLWLGSVPGLAASQPFDGAFADVAVFPAALTAGQAAFLAESTVVAAPIAAPQLSLQVSSPGSGSPALLNAGVGSFTALSLQPPGRSVAASASPTSGVTLTSAFAGDAATASACVSGFKARYPLAVSFWLRLNKVTAPSSNSMAIFQFVDGGTCTSSDSSIFYSSPYPDFAMTIPDAAPIPYFFVNGAWCAAYPSSPHGPHAAFSAPPGPQNVLPLSTPRGRPALVSAGGTLRRPSRPSTSPTRGSTTPSSTPQRGWAACTLTACSPSPTRAATASTTRCRRRARCGSARHPRRQTGPASPGAQEQLHI